MSSLASWLADWLAGSLVQAAVVLTPTVVSPLLDLPRLYPWFPYRALPHAISYIPESKSSSGAAASASSNGRLDGRSYSLARARATQLSSSKRQASSLVRRPQMRHRHCSRLDPTALTSLFPPAIAIPLCSLLGLPWHSPIQRPFCSPRISHPSDESAHILYTHGRTPRSYIEEQQYTHVHTHTHTHARSHTLIVH